MCKACTLTGTLFSHSWVLSPTVLLLVSVLVGSCQWAEKEHPEGKEKPNVKLQCRLYISKLVFSSSTHTLS